MASVLKRCTIFVGIDSGPMHVATAAGIPVVALFGAGEYERFKPRGTDNEVIRLGLSCYPCYENCKFEEAICTRGITVSQVKSVLANKLKSARHLEIGRN
jgi:ADP-heptose:LPS heptosyltransferase